MDEKAFSLDQLQATPELLFQRFIPIQLSHIGA
jgi:hypothetical protein